jgi:23S rRNA (guanosine2251-2'-O)-methyltransferase
VSRSTYIAGLRAVEQVLAAGTAEVRRVYAEYRTANPRVETVIREAGERGIEVVPANRARLTQLSGDSRHQGGVAEIHRSTLLDEAALRTLVEQRLESAGAKLLLLVLDGIQDPHNLGACLRTAEAAGVDAVVVPRHGAAGLGPTVSKVAAGAAESLPFAHVANLGRVLDWLRTYGVSVYGTSDRSEFSVYDSNFDRPLALVMGREESGLSKAVARRCDVVLGLPMQGSVSSLNVSVATGICLFEILRQRRPLGSDT